MDTLDKDQFTNASGISDKAAEQLKKAAPWMRFCGIIGTIGITGVLLILMVTITQAGNVIEWVAFFTVFTCAVQGGIISYYALRSSGAAYRVAESKSQEAMDEFALITQKGWMLAGVLIISGLFLFFTLFLLLVLGFDAQNNF
jgi:hypothetical protein